jgi:hypothetical protein
MYGPVDEFDLSPISEPQVFRLLDSLKPTATGPDGLPSWFLRLAAPLISKPLTHLINLSLSEGQVPPSWKAAIIHPIPKVPHPSSPSDLRPISVVPVLSRITERLVVRSFLYSSLSHLPPDLDYDCQFAYRPTSSTTAALVAILHTVTELLLNNPYVHCLTFDYSKAFDTLSHTSLAETLSLLDLPVNIRNWLIDYLYPRTQITSLNGSPSSPLSISAGVVQGSVLGPTLFNINSVTLKPLSPFNFYFKYADDGYLLVPAANSSTIQSEISHQIAWANSRNLKINPTKTAEIVFSNKRATPPPPIPGITRHPHMKILGIIVDEKLNFSAHLDDILPSCTQSFFALKTLRQHGTPDLTLSTIFKSIVISKLLYGAPAFWGFLNAHNLSRLEALFNRAVKLGFYPHDAPPLTVLQSTIEQNLFVSILSNPSHALHRFLPPPKPYSHNLRKLSHGLSLPRKDDRNFLNRQLYKDIF